LVFEPEQHVKSQSPKSYQAGPALLEDRVIIVTGANDGVGKAAALSFAAHAATVVLLGRSLPKLERVYDQITDAGYPRPAIYPMDLEGAQPDHYAEMADKIDGEFGRIDGLLHNAGALGELCSIDQYDVEQWYRVFQVNLHAPFLMTQACLPLLRKASDASVVFTSSSVGRRGRAYWGAYAASKFALEGLMQVLADELEANTSIRVNSLNPGRVRTKMRASAYPGENPSTLPKPEQIMAAYLFLMGPDSRGVSGQAIDAQ